MRYEFEAVGPIAVAAKMRSSDLVVTASESAAQVLVTVEPRRGGDDVAQATRVEMIGGRLEIVVPKVVSGLFRSSGSVHIEAVVPAGSSLEVESGSGDVRTSGQLGEVDEAPGGAHHDLHATLEGLDLRLVGTPPVDGEDAHTEAGGGALHGGVHQRPQHERDGERRFHPDGAGFRHDHLQPEPGLHQRRQRERRYGDRSEVGLQLLRHRHLHRRGSELGRHLVAGLDLRSDRRRDLLIR